VNPN